MKTQEILDKARSKAKAMVIDNKYSWFVCVYDLEQILTAQEDKGETYTHEEFRKKFMPNFKERCPRCGLPTDEFQEYCKAKWKRPLPPKVSK